MYSDTFNLTPEQERDDRIVNATLGAICILSLLYLPWAELWQFIVFAGGSIICAVNAIAPRFWPWLLFQVYRIAVFAIWFGCLYYVLHGIFH